MTKVAGANTAPPGTSKSAIAAPAPANAPAKGPKLGQHVDYGFSQVEVSCGCGDRYNEDVGGDCYEGCKYSSRCDGGCCSESSVS